jgi:hypothetical protein
MEAKTLFDLKYGYYRNILNKPAIPLEARQFIFNCMEAYAALQIKKSTVPVGQSEQLCLQCKKEPATKGIGAI